MLLYSQHKQTVQLEMEIKMSVVTVSRQFVMQKLDKQYSASITEFRAWLTWMLLWRNESCCSSWRCCSLRSPKLRADCDWGWSCMMDQAVGDGGNIFQIYLYFRYIYISDIYIFQIYMNFRYLSNQRWVCQ